MIDETIKNTTILLLIIFGLLFIFDLLFYFLHKFFKKIFKIDDRGKFDIY